MAATATLRFPLSRATYRTLIGLLAVTGMRIGEAIGLDRRDVDLAAGCVTVRGGKPGAARELPLHDTTLRALEEYCSVRDRRWPCAEVAGVLPLHAQAPGCSTRTSTRRSVACSPTRA